MPSSSAGLCRDCSSRAVQGTRYCSNHQVNNNAAQHKRLYDRSRANDPHRKLYRTRRWKHVRALVLGRDILCVDCKHKAATEVDHVENARVTVAAYGVDAFFDPERLQGLCHTCHSEKTLSESTWAGKR